MTTSAEGSPPGERRMTTPVARPSPGQMPLEKAVTWETSRINTGRGHAELVAGVRDRLLDEGRPLAGRCEEASGLLADALAATGLDPLLVWGEYDHPDGLHPTTGHCWVQHGDLILDPTRSQFDQGPMLSTIGTSQAAQYRFHYGLRIDELERPD